MSGFIANGSINSEATIANDGFWPSIDPADLRGRIRLDGSVAAERLRAAAINAMLSVNAELGGWQAQQRASGYRTLEAVPAPQVDGKSRHLQLYMRAVTCAVAAELSERYRSFDTTAAGNQRADDLAPSIDEWRRDQRWAISDFLDASRMAVELI